MFFFYFDFQHKYHRDFLFSHEMNIVILRLVQLRDTPDSKISSVRTHSGVELKRMNISQIDLTKLNNDEAENICRSLGYVKAPRGAKCDVIVNGKRYGIRSLNYNTAALVNHSTRPKYQKVCRKIGLSIDEFDSIIDNYIDRRKRGVFGEDISYSTQANPFIPHKEYLKSVLTFMAFHSFDYRRETDDDRFITDYIDGIIDFSDPADNNTWVTYSPINYFDSIWTSLCFSLRDSKGMPSDDKLAEPTAENESILRWNYPYKDETGRIRNKAALHIRVKKYDSKRFGTPFEKVFKKEIQNVKQNVGERDEYLIKLFLIECREKQLPVPIGQDIQIVRKVGKKDVEYGRLTYTLDWKSLSAEELISICSSVGAVKGGAYDKADIYINDIGISVKSRRGAPPSLINQTGRDKILRIMKMMNLPIAPLDQIVNRYWNFRFNGGTEDVNNEDNPNNPFCKNEDGESCLPILKPLLNYFAFRGTGTRDSNSPAQYILSIGQPDDIQTWVYYSEDDFVDIHWNRLVFSLRNHGMPQNRPQEMLPWIRYIDGKDKGLLNVRIK